MNTLIVPCAGRSVRHRRPKWLLTDPNGDLMVVKSISGLLLTQTKRLIIVIVRQHIEESKVNLDRLSQRLKTLTNLQPEFLILDDFTKSQSETIAVTIQRRQISGPIFIKDCDNYFETEVTSNNFVCVTALKDGINAVNKSYVSLDKFGKLTGVVEKHVIGELFCTGGYAFASSEDFLRTFDKIQCLQGINSGEIYISHIIQQMLLDEAIFRTQVVNNYEDFGTWREWKNYVKQYRTLFIDIDGCICNNSSEYFHPSWGESVGLTKNIEFLQQLYEQGKTTIILTTSRPESVRDITVAQLETLGFKYNNIIFGLPHAQRILINDYSSSNTYPTAIAINLKRNDDTLEELF